MTDSYACKICDFGLSRKITADNDRVQTRDVTALRWTAPEVTKTHVYDTIFFVNHNACQALQTGLFSFGTDVWSFGVVLHELYAFGELPYSKRWNNDKIRRLVAKGYRLPAPVCFIHVALVLCTHYL